MEGWLHLASHYVVLPRSGVPAARTVRGGVGSGKEAQFVSRFKIWERAIDRVLPAAQRSANTVMPWKQLGGMTRDDLSAIYAFLRDQKPVIHRVKKRDAAPPPERR